VDYYRPTATKDDWGGWNGPCTVIKNDPDWGVVTLRKAGNREILVHYPNVRHTLFIECFMVKEMGSDHSALRTVIEFIAGLQAGRAAMTFGYTTTKQGSLQQTSASQMNPRVHLALQFLIRNYFRL